jgi:hypothetical protein
VISVAQQAKTMTRVKSRMRRLWNASPLSGSDRVSQDKIIDFVQESDASVAKNGTAREAFFPDIDYPNHSYYKDFTTPTEELRREAFDHYSETFNRLFESEMQLAKFKESDPDAGRVPGASPGVEETTEVLRRDGIAGLQLSSDDRAAVVDLSRDAVRAVDDNRQQLPPERRGVEAVTSSVTNMKAPDEKYEFFSDMLARNGIFDACQQYYGMPFRLKFVVAQVNEADDQGIARACRFPDGTSSPLYYLHIDSNIGVMKAIIYRSEEVTGETGAFRYYPGSHSVLSATERCIRKANDKAGFDSVNKDKARAKFMALPPEVRLKANFGNDLIDHPEVTDRLLERERICGTNGGDVLLFDPNGMHRGAVFERPQARREILQVYMIPRLK